MYAALAKSERDAIRALGLILEPIREYGRSFAGSFKRNLIATAYSLITVSPMLMMVTTILTLVRAELLSNSTYATRMAWFCSTLSARMHTVTIWRAFAAVLAASVSAGLILGLLTALSMAFA